MSPPSNIELSVRWLFLLALVGIVLLGVWLRWAPACESLWVDELHTGWVVADDYADIPARAAIGNYSPFYFLLLKPFVDVFGLHDWVIRLPSFIASVLLIPVGYWAVMRWTGSRTAGLVAAMLIALDKNFIWFGTEARPYALVQLIGLLQVMIFRELIVSRQMPDENETEKDRAAVVMNLLRIGFILTSLALFYLHYTTALLLLTEGVYFAVLVIARTCYRPWRTTAYRWRWPSVLLDGFVITLGCSAVLRHILEIVGRKDNWTFVPDATWQMLFSFGPRAMFPLEYYVFLPAYLLGVFVIVRWALLKRPIAGRIDGKTFWLVVMWLMVPLLLAWGLTYSDVARLYFRRYLIVCAVAPILIGAMLCSLCQGRVLRAIAGVLIIAGAFYHAGAIDSTGYVFENALARRPVRFEDWRGAVARINQSPASKDFPVIVRSGWIEASQLTPGFVIQSDPSKGGSLRARQMSDGGELQECFMAEYCASTLASVYRLEPGERMIMPVRNNYPGRALTRDQLQVVIAQGGAWLVCRGNRRTADILTRITMAKLQQMGASVSTRERACHGSLWVVRIAATRESPK